MVNRRNAQIGFAASVQQEVLMSTAAAPSRSRPSIPEAEDLAASMPAGLPRGVAEALADPIVQALMAADHVDPRGLAALMRVMAAQLSDNARSTGRDFSW
jgi:hypothetical protein